MANGWAFLSGFANTLGGRMQADYENEQKQKLYQMQQDAEMKRQQFLEKYRSDLEMERDKAKDERQKDDVVGTFKDPETGTYFGRTRGGGSIPLHATSEDYQKDLAEGRDVKLEKDKLGTEAQQARIDRMRKEVENYDSLIGKRNQTKPEKTPKDPDDNYIRGLYNKQLHEMQYPVDPQTGKPTTTAAPGFNRAEADAKVRGALSDAYGQDKVNKILGNSVKEQVAAGFDKTNTPAPKQTVSAEALMQAASDAVRRGADPKAVQARLQQLMQQNGYDPQPAQ